MAKRLEDMMENLMVVQERQLSGDELVRARIGKNESIILGLARQYENQDTRIGTVENRMDNIELNEEITDEQAAAITTRVKARVSKVLNYPNGDSEVYYRTFISNIYAYLRHSHSLGSKLRTTKKKHFDTVMRGIEAWHPDVQELKDKKDMRDKAKEEQE